MSWQGKNIAGYWKGIFQDHVRILIEVRPKYAVWEIVGYLKGKSAIAVARQSSGRKRNFNSESLWARGNAVSTFGFEESRIKRKFRNPEQLDGKRSDEIGEF